MKKQKKASKKNGGQKPFFPGTVMAELFMDLQKRFPKKRGGKRHGRG